MKGYFAYIRVSTVKQGEKGSSLQEQQGAIEAYARRHGLNIAEWFEEKETAAKQGRPVFARMLQNLECGIAAGVITHKIDRSARNLRDWAMLGELVDRGIELHFAHESIDLSSRGGRLSADIQAVVAADYVRNLRDEVKKGFYGRLKQGLYPLRAPIGYLDQGGGKPKTIDPLRGSLVAKAFELYATARWSLDTLSDELHSLGLRTKAGRKVTRNGLSTILNNPFYTGRIWIEKTREMYQGVHEPIIGKQLFDRVKEVLSGRITHKANVHFFRYQRLLRCASCGRTLASSRHKGHVYYRCTTSTCPTTCVREELIDETLRGVASLFVFDDSEWAAIGADIEIALASREADRATELQTLALAVAAIDDRLARLTDAYIDRAIERDMYLSRKEQLLNERCSFEANKAAIEAGDGGIRRRIGKILELIKALQNMPGLANDGELRDLLKDTTSNLTVDRKNLAIAWSNPFNELVFDQTVTLSGPKRIKLRTFSSRMTQLASTIMPHSSAFMAAAPIPVSPSRPGNTKPNSGARNIVEFNRRRQAKKDVEMHGSDDIAA